MYPLRLSLGKGGAMKTKLVSGFLVLVGVLHWAEEAFPSDPAEIPARDAGRTVEQKARAGWALDDCIDGRCDRECPVYGIGETMTFTFRLRGFEGMDKTTFFFDWTRTADDGKKESGRATAAEPLVLTTSLDRPGFVRYYIELKDAAGEVVLRKIPSGEKNVFFDGGAGVDILNIRQGVPEPADFDAFWAKHKANLAKVAWRGLEKIVKIDSSNPAVDVYTVSVPCAGGMPATGFLYVPTAAKDGRKFPAQIRFHGYGASWNATHPRADRMKGDMLVLDCTAHGFELMRESDYYRALRKKVSVNGFGYAFDPKTNADPETAYFCGMAYRLMRALEFLKSRPEWDGKNLMAAGASMGGMQTVWAAALDPDVTEALADIPWCCDIGGEVVGRNRGTWYVKWSAPGLGYYDPVNLAKRIPVRTRFGIPRFGLGDYTCPPTGVMAMYNNVPCPDKRATGFQNSTHGYVVPRPRQMIEIRGNAIVPFTR